MSIHATISAFNRSFTLRWVFLFVVLRPELVCPRSFNVEVLRGTDGATVDYNPPTPVGNFASLTNPPPPGSFFGVGDTTLIYSFSGPTGGISRCEFTISVIEGKWLRRLANSANLRVFYFLGELLNWYFCIICALNPI